MSKAPTRKLVVAVSSRALFDLEDEHDLFEKKGYEAYRDFQVRHKNDILAPGVAFPFVQRLLKINELFEGSKPFDVITLSRNSPETAQRFFNSCRHYNLPVTSGAFTSGQSTFPYIKAFNVSLFLSANKANVDKAVSAGLPAGLVIPGSIEKGKKVEDDDQASLSLRIAFDFDGVIADDESEKEFQREGINNFHRYEQEKANTPHAPGPLSELFESLSYFQRLDYKTRGAGDPYFNPAIRISVVTARGAPSEERLITTLKALGMSATELFLLDGRPKKPILEAIKPHIFFDDQRRQIETLSEVPSVLIPFGIHNQEKK